ncbi:putative pumilio [Monocercomonoides exilis]|uniref:putative pumilio n=1 Tax=Monocercomonoides exilis TaxID=2049356 RepID=UPI00355A4EE1|nr:putative pumilio [Monocercomonoides exilis]|eukprot:MONOS_11654.1-p1 / transcript=MONOS_11654.1 / gene=MONOS_11654 / organism=Monocercomonoides_exilis_PA203 / gene_product=pumilio / transcript_product=pumilio / location=Mono_scaffold00598:6038-10918(-) / protein_length=1595 / sequence_SO=supercontig / SO=protein_coding / is_pseudo=false
MSLQQVEEQREEMPMPSPTFKAYQQQTSFYSPNFMSSFQGSPQICYSLKSPIVNVGAVASPPTLGFTTQHSPPTPAIMQTGSPSIVSLFSSSSSGSTLFSQSSFNPLPLPKTGATPSPLRASDSQSQDQNNNANASNNSSQAQNGASSTFNPSMVSVQAVQASSPSGDSSRQDPSSSFTLAATPVVGQSSSFMQPGSSQMYPSIISPSLPVPQLMTFSPSFVTSQQSFGSTSTPQVLGQPMGSTVGPFIIQHSPPMLGITSSPSFSTSPFPTTSEELLKLATSSTFTSSPFNSLSPPSASPPSTFDAAVRSEQNQLQRQEGKTSTSVTDSSTPADKSQTNFSASTSSSSSSSSSSSCSGESESFAGQSVFSLSQPFISSFATPSPSTILVPASSAPASVATSTGQERYLVQEQQDAFRPSGSVQQLQNSYQYQYFTPSLYVSSPSSQQPQQQQQQQQQSQQFVPSQYIILAQPQQQQQQPQPQPQQISPVSSSYPESVRAIQDQTKEQEVFFTTSSSSSLPSQSPQGSPVNTASAQMHQFSMANQSQQQDSHSAHQSSFNQQAMYQQEMQRPQMIVNQAGQLQPLPVQFVAQNQPPQQYAQTSAMIQNNPSQQSSSPQTAIQASEAAQPVMIMMAPSHMQSVMSPSPQHYVQQQNGNKTILNTQNGQVAYITNGSNMSASHSSPYPMAPSASVPGSASNSLSSPMPSSFANAASSHPPQYAQMVYAPMGYAPVHPSAEAVDPQQFYRMAPAGTQYAQYPNAQDTFPSAMAPQKAAGYNLRQFQPQQPQQQLQQQQQQQQQMAPYGQPFTPHQQFQRINPNAQKFVSINSDPSYRYSHPSARSSQQKLSQNAMIPMNDTLSTSSRLSSSSSQASNSALFPSTPSSLSSDLSSQTTTFKSTASLASSSAASFGAAASSTPYATDNQLLQHHLQNRDVPLSLADMKGNVMAFALDQVGSQTLMNMFRQCAPLYLMEKELRECERNERRKKKNEKKAKKGKDDMKEEKEEGSADSKQETQNDTSSSSSRFIDESLLSTSLLTSKLLDELVTNATSVYLLAVDPFGSSVLKAAVLKMRLMQLKRVAFALSGRMLELATHTFGCRLVQSVMDALDAFEGNEGVEDESFDEEAEEEEDEEEEEEEEEGEKENANTDESKKESDKVCDSDKDKQESEGKDKETGDQKEDKSQAEGKGKEENSANDSKTKGSQDKIKDRKRIIHHPFRGLTGQQVSRHLAVEIFPHSLLLLHNQNGNHVIQRCIECPAASESDLSLVLSILNRNMPTNLARHPYGCRVFQRLAEHLSPAGRIEMVKGLLGDILAVVLSQFGNYVISHLMVHCDDNGRSLVVNALSGSFFILAKQKYSSNVVEKCIVYSSPQLRRNIIKELSCAELPQRDWSANSYSDIHPLMHLLYDQFGNYVAQRVFDYSPSEQKAEIWAALSGVVEEILSLSSDAGGAQSSMGSSKSEQEAVPRHIVTRVQRMKISLLQPTLPLPSPEWSAARRAWKTHRLAAAALNASSQSHDCSSDAVLNQDESAQTSTSKQSPRAIEANLSAISSSSSSSSSSLTNSGSNYEETSMPNQEQNNFFKENMKNKSLKVHTT